MLDPQRSNPHNSAPPEALTPAQPDIPPHLRSSGPIPGVILGLAPRERRPSNTDPGLTDLQLPSSGNSHDQEVPPPTKPDTAIISGTVNSSPYADEIAIRALNKHLI